jgi:hypothetical protein
MVGMFFPCSFVLKHADALEDLGPWGGAKTKMKTKHKPSILELTVSIFLCLDLPDFVPWGGCPDSSYY